MANPLNCQKTGEIARLFYGKFYGKLGVFWQIDK